MTAASSPVSYTHLDVYKRQVFGHDPRIYQTTVKEFLKDKNGNLTGLITVKLEAKKDEKPVV